MIDYSIIIPAYNEATLLPTTLTTAQQAMKTVDEFIGEIIVVDNNSSDNSAEIARAAGATVVNEPIHQISRARNSGAGVANGRFMLFLDADTLLPAKLLRQAINNLQANNCCGGGATVDFTGGEVGLIISMLIMFWNWLAINFKLAAGCFIYCTREGFDAIGGFSEDLYVGEELKFSRNLTRWGRGKGLIFKIITNSHILTSPRKVEWHSSLKIVLVMLLFMLFPLAVRFKWCCSLWYKRPDIND